MNNVLSMIVRSGTVATALVALAPTVSAQAFNGGLPDGWTCAGECGTAGANGDVPLSGTPGSTAYGFVVTTDSTASGLTLSPFDAALGFGGGGLGSETNGSRVRSTTFAALAGQALDFRFNYISSDGTAGYVEYGWALVRDAADSSVEALLFTGRTTPSGAAVPGFGLPAPSAGVVLNSGNPVNITENATNWAPLGGDSGGCFGDGCGNTGWVTSNYTFSTTGSYILEFGVINWEDELYQAGLAFDGITVAGTPIEQVPTTPGGPPVVPGPVDPLPPVNPIPEPETYALMLAGLAMMSFVVRRRRAQIDR